MSKLPLPVVHLPYMTEVKGRQPQAKAHRTMAHAKAALVQYGSQYGRVRGGRLFEWIDGGWRELYYVPTNSRRDELPWLVEVATEQVVEAAIVDQLHLT